MHCFNTSLVASELITAEHTDYNEFCLPLRLLLNAKQTNSSDGDAHDYFREGCISEANIALVTKTATSRL